MDWHARYLQQASWTREVREYLLTRAGISHAEGILEVGCGTGVILQDVIQMAEQHAVHPRHVLGLDISVRALKRARSFAPEAILVRGDAMRLPLADACVDIAYCHFLLLWLHDPGAAIREMRRVTRPGGYVLALAEPDYSGREDLPAALAKIGALQTAALAAQGADPAIGSRVADLFDRAGLRIVETGMIAPQNPASISEHQWKSEWATIRQDLADRLSESELDRLQQEDVQARHAGQRQLFVPTYFVHAQV
jgi:ubiquinone/menaquinone biosynthesis C-methylase UbiE